MNSLVICKGSIRRGTSEYDVGLTFDFENYDQFMQALVGVWHAKDSKERDKKFLTLTV